VRLLFPSLICLVALTAWAGDPQLSWDDMRNIKTQGESRSVDFAPKLRSLDGQVVTLEGWMTPFNLGDGTTVTQFLLTGTPGTCPFCLGVGPESFILIDAAEAVPIDITGKFLFRGRFKLSQDTATTGFYYQLEEARVLSRH
jgi:hypothetical protein